MVICLGRKARETYYWDGKEPELADCELHSSIHIGYADSVHCCSREEVGAIPSQKPDFGAGRHTGGEPRLQEQCHTQLLMPNYR